MWPGCERAGAIIMGKTHMPVGGKAPPTRNPWNLEHTAGGTSSGSGAAVGARMVPVAIGEQTAGSNMRPAAYCGVAGIKPSYGRISRFGCMPFSWSLDHVGIIGLSVADLALVLSAIAGPDPRDPTTLPDPAPPADLDVASIRPPRIGVVRNFFPELSEPVMRDAVDDAASQLREAGATVSDLLLPETFGLTWRLHRIISGAEGSTYHAADHDDSALPGSGGRVGSLLPAAYYVQARRIRSWLRAALAETFRDVDAMAMPTAPGPAPKGQSTGDAVLLRPWSLPGIPDGDDALRPLAGRPASGAPARRGAARGLRAAAHERVVRADARTAASSHVGRRGTRAVAITTVFRAPYRRSWRAESSRLR